MRNQSKQNKAFVMNSVCAVIALLSGCATQSPNVAAPSSSSFDLNRIEHVVVIYAENRSFDNLFGYFPGAEGIAGATAEQKTQLDLDGKPLAVLPPIYHSGKVDEHLPKGLPNGPFRADQPPVNLTFNDKTPNPTHRFYMHQEQINGGKNNMFVAIGNTGAWPMATYDGSSLKLWKWAQEYTLMDHFFQGAFGGSFLNHQWLACACPPEYKNAPALVRTELDANGKIKRKANAPVSVMQGLSGIVDGRVTPDGYVVNEAQPPYQPSLTPPATGANPDFADPGKLEIPVQTSKTIGDTMSAKGVSWMWFGEGWNAALADGRQEAGKPRVVINARTVPGSLVFQTNHQPFNYFARFAPGTPDREKHLRDGEEFLNAIDKGTLPQVSFFKPAGRNSQHSGYTNVAGGDARIDEILTRLRASPQWSKMMVIVTWDEFGGYWDHVPPPTGAGWGDRWGPGSRVATLIVSPFAKRGFVDKTVYDTTSILKFITKRFGLEPLAGVREKMGDLTNALRN